MLQFLKYFAMISIITTAYADELIKRKTSPPSHGKPQGTYLTQTQAGIEEQLKSVIQECAPYQTYSATYFEAKNARLKAGEESLRKWHNAFLDEMKATQNFSDALEKIGSSLGNCDAKLSESWAAIKLYSDKAWQDRLSVLYKQCQNFKSNQESWNK